MTKQKVPGFPDRGQVWVYCCNTESEATCKCHCHMKEVDDAGGS